MLEIPESHVLAQQLNETIQGKIISVVQAGQTPIPLPGIRITRKAMTICWPENGSASAGG